MTTFVPVTPARHAAMRWRRCASYAFAAQRAVVPLVGAELARAALAFPVAFISTDGTFAPAAVCGLESNRNLFVGKDGRWQNAYVPSALRGYPFALGRAEGGRQLLCVDEASGLVTAEPQGERFFEDDETPAAAVRQVMDFLKSVERNRRVTAAACAGLQAAGVIEPWPIVLKTDHGERTVEGLFRASEAALRAMADEAFLGLRKTGALPLAYAQLLSMQQLRALGERATAQSRGAQLQWGQDLDLSMFEGDTVKFDFGKLH